MSATIITNFSGSFEYEPEIISDTARDGITAFQFRVVGTLSSLNSIFLPDEEINGVPDQPNGIFRVVRRSIEHIAGDPETGLYRLSISGEGGTGDSSLFISETSFSLNSQQVQGNLNLSSGQIPIQYTLRWLYPSATITTNSASENISVAQSLATSIVSPLNPQILRDRPTSDLGTIAGPSLVGNPALDTITITGTSIEKAGGLYRVRVTATKGLDATS